MSRSVLDSISPEPNTGCWLFTGHLDRAGYGQTVGGPAHRVIYERLMGLVPDGLDLDHRCRVRWCVNPAHLEPVTHRENARRGNSPMGLNARKTHCLRGHAFDAVNTEIRRNGNRDCLACRKLRSRTKPATLPRTALRAEATR